MLKRPQLVSIVPPSPPAPPLALLAPLPAYPAPPRPDESHTVSYSLESPPLPPGLARVRTEAFTPGEPAWPWLRLPLTIVLRATVRIPVVVLRTTNAKELRPSPLASWPDAFMPRMRRSATSVGAIKPSASNVITSTVPSNEIPVLPLISLTYVLRVLKFAANPP